MKHKDVNQSILEGLDWEQGTNRTLIFNDKTKAVVMHPDTLGSKRYTHTSINSRGNYYKDYDSYFGGTRWKFEPNVNFKQPMKELIIETYMSFGGCMLFVAATLSVIVLLTMPILALFNLIGFMSEYAAVVAGGLSALLTIPAAVVWLQKDLQNRKPNWVVN